MKPSWRKTIIVAVFAAVVGFCAGFACGQHTPASELAAVVKDAERLGPAASQFRWVTSYTIDDADRADANAVLSFVLNSLSRASRIVVPEAVDGTDGRIVRIDLAAYGFDPILWEALIADDPYWHIKTEVLGHDGKRNTVFTDGGWAGLDNSRRLRAVSHSGGAVARLDWFVAKVVEPPAYYAWAGIPLRLADWYGTLGVDPKLVFDFRANRGANLIVSGVTKKPRRLTRWQGVVGGVWQTYDTANKEAIKDPLRNPAFGGDYDASENIATKPNGLHVFALFDGKGNRVDSAPDFIAKDDTDAHDSGILRPMVSCVRCHVDDGFRTFEDDTKKMLAGGPALIADDPVTADHLAAFYGLDGNTVLKRSFARDQEDYAEAVALAAGGRTGNDVAESLAKVYRGYALDMVTPAAAAKALGVKDVSMFRFARNDPYLYVLAQGRAIPTKAWEDSYPTAAILAELWSTPE